VNFLPVFFATRPLLFSRVSNGPAPTTEASTSVYMSAYKTGTPEVADEIRAILNIPADFEPITLVPIGYPGAEPGPKNIKTPDEVIFHETFGHK
jgi:hypothetical protein